VEALNSVINQTYPNIELLIADDCSPDHSVGVIQDWLKNHPNVYFSANEKNLGNTKTFNKLAKKTKGEFIIDLAADDILLPNCIEKQVITFQNSKYKNLGIVYGNLIEIDEKGIFIRNYYTEEDHPESGNIYKMVIGRSTKICSVSSMVKKSVFEKLGYYDENLAYEDLDLWVRASRLYEFEYIDAFLVKKRELSTSLSAFFTQRNNKKTKRLHESSLAILKKGYDLNQTKDEYKALFGRIQFEFYKFLKSKEYLLLCQLFILGLKTKYKTI
jgi:glycosyltransferase involved in cell wall biosynthesis